jgi:hypothetical protein
MELSHAPIGLFVYKRPEHARRTVESLLRCDGIEHSRIFVFADGPKGDADRLAVESTRRVVRELLGARAEYVEQPKNIGLATSITSGVATLCNRFGVAIVVEDDLLLERGFLAFMNEGLRRYASEARVMQISGYSFDLPSMRGQDDAHFFPIASTWGWATWKRAWDNFDLSATGWRQFLQDRCARRAFDLGGAYPYSEMLRRQMDGEIDSWGIRWYFSLVKRQGLVLFPPRTLVLNRGFDESGTHGRSSSYAEHEGFRTGGNIRLPEMVEVSARFDEVGSAIRAARRRGRLAALRRAVFGRFFRPPATTVGNSR